MSSTTTTKLFFTGFMKTNAILHRKINESKSKPTSYHFSYQGWDGLFLVAKRKNSGIISNRSPKDYACYMSAQCLWNIQIRIVIPAAEDCLAVIANAVVDAVTCAGLATKMCKTNADNTADNTSGSKSLNCRKILLKKSIRNFCLENVVSNRIISNLR